MRPDPEVVAGNPRAALLRAGIAALVMIVLLFFVLGSEPEQEAAAPLPAPEVAAPEPEAIEPPPSLLLSPSAAPQGESVAPLPIEVHTPEVAPAQEAAAVAPSSVAESAPAPVPAPVQPAKPAPPPAPGAVAPAPASGAKPHFVQLVDFGPLPAAKNLFDAAATAGHPGRLMHRVLVGPFASRDAARKAVEGGTKGIAVHSSGSWWVQAGVFSDADNADRQRATLSLAGHQVVVHGRADIGPFPSRAAAEKALTGMRESFGKPLPDAAIVAAR